MEKMIECNPRIAFGQPKLVDRRLTVFDVVIQIYYSDDIKTVLDDYNINMEQATAALIYCRELKCKTDPDLVNFCDGCILRTLQDGWDFKRNDYVEVKSDDGKISTISLGGKSVFLGTLAELEDSEFGKVTWLLADEVVNTKL